MSESQAVVPLICRLQCAPSVVETMTPSVPTAQPCCPSGAKAALDNDAVVPLGCGDQFTPPSLVAMIVPFSPTAQPCCPSDANLTPYSPAVVPLVCGCHVTPLSVVTST